MRSIMNDEFKVGEKVSYYINCDCWAGEVIKVTPARVTVKFPFEEKVFTKRPDGKFRLKGFKFGKLNHGGETHLPPEV